MDRRNIVRWLCRLILVCLVIGGVACAGGYWFVTTLDDRTPGQQAVFHTVAPQEGVTIPFEAVGSLILVQAEIDGKKVRCMLDTGSNLTLADRGHNITGQPLYKRLLIGDGAVHVKTYEQRLLKSVRLGAFEVSNLRGWRLFQEAPAPNGPEAEGFSILLGNAFFNNTVLTIDYRAHTLHIQPADSQPVLAKSSDDVVLDFTYDGVRPPTGWGVPCVEGTIEGQKVRCIVDTGWGAAEMGVSPAVFAGIYPAQKRTPTLRNFVFGSSTVETLPEAHLDLGDFHVSGPILETPLLGRGKQFVGGFTSDVILGSSTLQYFKTTIDYSARQIRLHAYK